MKKIKIIILYILKYMGLFWLMRKSSRRKLRILCYHGISLRDEHDFLPVLFMSERLFRHRMAILSRLKYPVISLDTAVAALKKDSLPDHATVITFDDGWEGIFTKAVPILQEHDFPASIYITSYYAKKQIPVLNVLLQYILWKTTALTFDLDLLAEDGLTGRVSLESRAQRQKVSGDILSYLEDKYSATTRRDHIERIAGHLDVGWRDMQASGMFRLASPEMIGEYSTRDGIDMELHTHRHIFPDTSFEECQAEIQENQQCLLEWTGKKSYHFCYPSGWYAPKQLSWLAKMGVLSATTVQSGLNDGNQNLWELDRFLDGENVSDIEFEAELCGLSDFLRRMVKP